MKKWIVLLLAALVPPAAAQDHRQQYAEQWPLSVSSEQSGAYRVTLEPQIYRRAWSPQLADVQVYNAAGQALPSALLAPDQPLAQPPVQRELPWFVLPPLDARSRNDLQLLTERDSDGRVRRVEARMGGGAAARPGGWLIDATVLGQQPLAAIMLDWSGREEPLQVNVRVDASDDLNSWQPVQAEVPLVDLQRAGKRLLQRRVEIAGNARYLRILPAGEGALPVLRAVDAELPAAPATLPWEWMALQPKAAAAGRFEFELDGRYPIARVDVTTDDNSLVRWTAWSRDDPGADWHQRTTAWVAYQVQGADAQRQRSPAQTLASPTRDRYWKLEAEPASAAVTPVLQLGYQPEVLVFLSQGAAPYALAVGSATAVRVDAPVAVLVDELRLRNGPEWQPTLARLEGTAEPLAGDAALRPPLDWKRWMLWGALLLGVLLVAALALSVLRQKPA
ncbi:DUF3999 domain-containing protein [Xanthomonas sp. 60]